MHRPRRVRSLIAAAAALGLVAGCSSQDAQAGSVSPTADARPGLQPELGVMGTIPLYWGEAAGVEEVLAGEGEPHWARAQLEERFALRPLAALTSEALADLDFLLLAQPSALSPAENVALDDWVRAGGRLLLFADPMLTGESRFGIGDRRRPQDVILLSPILRRWGLELEFVEDQSAGLAMREIAGRAIPTNLAGRFALPAEGAACSLESGGLLADCTIEQGRAVVLADAALLDLHHPGPQAAPALEMLVARAFGAGDIAGLSLAGAGTAAEKPESQSVAGAPSPPAGTGEKLDPPVRNPR